MKLIRKARLILAGLFFIFMTLVLLNLDPLTRPLYGVIPLTQFVPSLLRFISWFFSLAAGGFIVVLVLTLFFGRVYCSVLCPMGIYQDMVTFIKRKLFRSVPRRYKPVPILRYALLALAAVLALAGTILVLNVFEPYSGFSRMITWLVKPPAYFIYNLVVGALESHKNYSLARAVLQPLEAGALVFSGVFFIAVTALTAWKPRFFCGNLCPVGTLLGLVSRFSLMKVRIGAGCSSCGLCEKSCNAGCLDAKNKTVDPGRCVVCFNCLAACKTGGLTYSLKKTPARPLDTVRREMIREMGSGFIALAGIAAFGGLISPQSLGLKRSPVSPPGSGSIRRFNSFCTSCHFCVSACPTKVIAPSFGEYGLTGFLQPRMDYEKGFCQYECIECGQVCPTGAIKPLTVPQKKLTQIGTARYIMEKCIVYVKNSGCAACNEACPTQAVSMVPYKNGLNPATGRPWPRGISPSWLNTLAVSVHGRSGISPSWLKIPQVTESVCIGCGACEKACPVRPERAIIVTGNAVHKTAEPPQKDDAAGKDDKKGGGGGDFPF